MGDKSSIEWTDATWNPIVGCSVVSPGCTNCYAMREAASQVRRFKSEKYAGLTIDTKAGPVWNGEVKFVEPTLAQVFRWKTPRRIFVNSMSDLFHEAIPDDWIWKVFAIMALSPQHRFQILTKRHERMFQFCKQVTYPALKLAIEELIKHVSTGMAHDLSAAFMLFRGEGFLPLPNVWLGVSVEDQARADMRIPYLLSTPAAVRFISAEPLLGPINLRSLRETTKMPSGAVIDAYDSCLSGKKFNDWTGEMDDGHPKLDWVIVGGESGSSARPMELVWAQQIRDACVRDGVPFFFKQWGEFDAAGGKVGKHVAGRMLDGQVYQEMPA